MPVLFVVFALVDLVARFDLARACSDPSVTALNRWPCSWSISFVGSDDDDLEGLPKPVAMPSTSAMAFAKGFGTPGRAKEPQTKTPLTILALTGSLEPTECCPENPYSRGSIPTEGHPKTPLIYKNQGRFQGRALHCTALHRRVRRSGSMGSAACWLRGGGRTVAGSGQAAFRRISWRGFALPAARFPDFFRPPCWARLPPVEYRT